MIHLDRIQRRFGARIVFDGLSWLIPKEARYGLVGPNGAGKTTLLRLIAEDDHPDAGTIHRAGTVRIELARRDGDVILAIADEGSGADGAGAGTGLSIVRALVADELHGTFALAGPRAEVVFPA